MFAVLSLSFFLSGPFVGFSPSFLSYTAADRVMGFDLLVLNLCLLERASSGRMGPKFTLHELEKMCLQETLGLFCIS
jgi:hypothetical protein